MGKRWSEDESEAERWWAQHLTPHRKTAESEDPKGEPPPDPCAFEYPVCRWLNAVGIDWKDVYFIMEQLSHDAKVLLGRLWELEIKKAELDYKGKSVLHISFPDQYEENGEERTWEEMCGEKSTV